MPVAVTKLSGKESLSDYVAAFTESYQDGSGAPDDNKALLERMQNSADRLMTLLRWNANDSPTLHATFLRAAAELYEAASLLGNQDLLPAQQPIVGYLEGLAREAVDLLMKEKTVPECSVVEREVLARVSAFHSCVEMTLSEKVF